MGRSEALEGSNKRADGTRAVCVSSGELRVSMHWWFRLVFRGRRVECRRGGALGLVFVELFLSLRRCLPSGRQVVRVVCGGPGRGAKDADGGAAYQLCRASCAPGRRVPERAHLPSHHEGAGNQRRSRSVSKAPRHIKVYGPCLSPSSFEGGLFLCF